MQKTKETLIRSPGQEDPLKEGITTHSKILAWRIPMDAQSYLTLCHPMDCSTPGLRVHHQLPEFTQTHVHRVGDAVVPFSSRLQSSPASGSLPVSQFFVSGDQSIGVSASASVLPVNIQLSGKSIDTLGSGSSPSTYPLEHSLSLSFVLFFFKSVV